MRATWLAMVLLAAFPSAGAQTIVPATAAQGALCRSAVAAAERENDLPPQLLAAISRVESGRRDPLTGETHPWPWTVNAGGQAYYYDTKSEAVAAVLAFRARGIQSLDVGCGQINLMHHPNAFPNLEVAFDPQANADYAARFLRQLFAQTGDWSRAAAAYHSATPGIGARYQQKVMAVWPDEQRFADQAPRTALARAWSATLTAPVPGFARVPHTQPPGLAIGLAYQPPLHRVGG